MLVVDSDIELQIAGTVRSGVSATIDGDNGQQRHGQS